MSLWEKTGEPGETHQVQGVQGELHTHEAGLEPSSPEV